MQRPASLSMRSEDDDSTILDNPHGIAMTRLLKSRAWARADPGNHEGLKQRLEMMRDAGLKPMKVISAATLARLGRIPRSTEDVELEDALDLASRSQGLQIMTTRTSVMPGIMLLFFSHRWLRPNWCIERGKEMAWD